MFIRTRKIKLKNGQLSEIYQAVFSYRQDSKAKQEVVGLGKYSSPTEYLKDWERYLEKMEEELSVPLDSYKEIRYSRMFKRLVLVQVPLKIAQKKRMGIMRRYEREKSKYVKLKKLCKMSCK
jgi:hypothetical protein